MKRWWLAVFMPLLVVACGDEGPTEVGAGLLPTDAIRTFEVLLSPEQYLVFDTAFALYSEPSDAPFMIVANQFDGGMSANSLQRFALPTALSVIDTAGVGRLDSVPRWIGGTVRFQIDTLRTNGLPVRLALYRTAQEWTESATWQLRRDDDGVRQPWTTPGGTRGMLIDTLTVTAGSDTVEFQVDSATLRMWADTTNTARGALIVAQTANGRVRATVPVLNLQARSSHRPDTVYTASATASASTFIFTPEQPTVSSQPRIGGTPAWRTVIRLRERMDTLTFACPGVPNCQFRMNEARLNFAGLRLQPVPPPAGFRPEGALTIAAYLLLPSPQIPLQRSPLGDVIGVATVPVNSFAAPDAPVFDMPLTELIRVLAMNPADRPQNFIGSHVALVGADPLLFGFTTFAAMPPLRLVVSITREMQLP